MIEIQVPARICLFGDHQDYLGLPVIAAAIDRFIHIRATPNDRKVFAVHLEDLGERFEISLEEGLGRVEAGDYFRSALSVLKQEGLGFEKGYDLGISGNIPINAGHSSSSALLVAWIRYLAVVQYGERECECGPDGNWANSPG